MLWVLIKWVCVLGEVILMSTHNICFMGKLRTLSQNYHQILLLNESLENTYSDSCVASHNSWLSNIHHFIYLLFFFLFQIYSKAFIFNGTFYMSRGFFFFFFFLPLFYKHLKTKLTSSSYTYWLIISTPCYKLPFYIHWHYKYSVQYM